MPQAFLFLTRVFREEGHAQDFLRGQIRAGTLRSYRDIEDECRSDPMEGVFDSAQFDEVIARYVHIPEAVMKLGDFAVWIHQPHEFVKRVKAAADKLGVEMDCRFVDYSRRPPSLGLKDVGLIFRKRKQYRYEREFRFSFESPQKVECPLILDVGDLSDIAKLFRTREFNGQLTITHGEPSADGRTRESALGWQDDL